MKTKHEIKFVTTESKTRLTAGKTCYQGQLQHNNVLTQKETRRWFAKYCSEPESRTTRYIDALGEFIAQEIANGNRLDFGPFAVGLKLRGGFKSSNGEFDEKTNSISVEMTPGADIKKAVEALRPVNVTDDTRWHISSTLQRTPYQVYDQIVADGLRKFTVTGYIPAVNLAQPDEGVWLESDAGEKVLVATVEKSEFAYADCTLDGSLERGDYWIVIQCRYRDEPNLVRCRRRIKVV